MKKIVLLTLAIGVLLLNNLYSFEAIDLFSFNGFNQSGNISVNVRLQDNDVDLYFSDTFETHGITLDDVAREDFILAINKALEWDDTAKKNNVDSFNKNIRLTKCKCFFKRTDWHYTNYQSVYFVFAVIDGKSFLVIPRITMQDKNNEFSSSDFKGIFIPIAMLSELKKVISDEYLQKKIKTLKEKDALFK